VCSGNGISKRIRSAIGGDTSRKWDQRENHALRVAKAATAIRNTGRASVRHLGGSAIAPQISKRAAAGKVESSLCDPSPDSAAKVSRIGIGVSAGRSSPVRARL